MHLKESNFTKEGLENFRKYRSTHDAEWRSYVDDSVILTDAFRKGLAEFLKINGLEYVTLVVSDTCDLELLFKQQGVTLEFQCQDIHRARLEQMAYKHATRERPCWICITPGMNRSCTEKNQLNKRFQQNIDGIWQMFAFMCALTKKRTSYKDALTPRKGVHRLLMHDGDNAIVWRIRRMLFFE